VVVDDQDRRGWLHASSLTPSPGPGIGANPDRVSGLAPSGSQGAARFGELRTFLTSALPGIGNPGPSGRTRQ
jgi:hypothetical protein